MQQNKDSTSLTGADRLLVRIGMMEGFNYMATIGVTIGVIGIIKNRPNTIMMILGGLITVISNFLSLTQLHKVKRGITDGRQTTKSD